MADEVVIKRNGGVKKDQNIKIWGKKYCWQNPYVYMTMRRKCVGSVKAEGEKAAVWMSVEKIIPILNRTLLFGWDVTKREQFKSAF